MAQVVFILGAGASQKAGAPLMADFLDVAHDLWKGGERPVPPRPYELVFEGISRLQRVHSKAQLDINNVESVFAAFEMARTLGTFSDYTKEQIDELIDATREVILHTLDATITLPVDGQTVRAPPPYLAFAELIGQLLAGPHPHRRRSVAVLTFNYDVAADFGCYQKHLYADYALSEQERQGHFPLLKLHGSLNWAYCAECNSVVPWTLQEYCTKYSWPDVLHRELREVYLEMGAHIKDFEHCGKKVEKAPVIVPPTWNKTEYHKTLAPVWARAAKELSEAEDLFIIGYSLPESDIFFRYLFALGTVGKSPLRRVWVFNPDQTGDVENRFRSLLGPGAQQRFEYYARTFEQAIPMVQDAYQLSR